MSRTPPNAIVLAAGVNRRLGKAPLPKSLLPLGKGETDPSFLERHAAVLRQHGVEKVIVVVSAEVRSRCTELDGVSYVVNPFDTGSTGSSLSLLCGLREHSDAANRGLLILDGDIVYERGLMEWVIEHCTESRLFVNPTTAGDDEEVRVYGVDPDAPRLLGKALTPRMVEGQSLLGESLGMIHVDAADFEMLRETTEWLVGWPPDRRPHGFAKERSEHEEIWQYLFHLGRMGVSVLPEGFLFSECDTPEDYQHVLDVIYPAIWDKDAARGKRA